MDLLICSAESGKRLMRMLALTFILLPNVVHAGIDVDYLMSIAWEGMWHQSGYVTVFHKWTQPLRVVLSGDIDRLNRQAIDEALADISQAAGLEYSMLDSGNEAGNVLIEVDDDSPKLAPTMPCATSFEWDTRGMKKATVSAKKSYVQKCMLHELGHVIGIDGHPYGRTVMTYFNRRNELSDYDKFIIKARYSPEMKHGMLPFRALKMIGDKYVASLESNEEQANAQQRIDKFKTSLLHEMKQYAEGKGEPPNVIYRSGRISMQAMETGRTTMKYYLGVALMEGDLGVTDTSSAESLLTAAAAEKYQWGAWALAWRYREGKHLKKDMISAYSWFACAASLGNETAKQRQKQIEETLSESDLPAYREAAAELQARLTQQAAKRDVASAPQ